MRRTLSCTVLLLAVLLGCSHESSAPEPEIFGYWSAPRVTFAVNAKRATLDFGCGAFVSPGPVFVAEDGSFAFDARSADGLKSTPVHTDGRFLGSVVEIEWTYQSYDGDLALPSYLPGLQPLVRVDRLLPIQTPCSFPVTP